MLNYSQLIVLVKVRGLIVKKSLAFVLIGFFSLPIIGIAGNALFSRNTPVQVFHSENTSAAATVTHATHASPNQAAALAKVRAIMLKAKQEQNQHTQMAVENLTSEHGDAHPLKPVSQEAPSQGAKITAKPTMPLSQGSNNSELEAQLSTLNQNNLLFEQRTNQQIEQLSNQNKELSDKVKRLREALLLLNQEVIQLNKQHLKSAYQQPTATHIKRSDVSIAYVGNWLQNLQNYFGPWFNYLIFTVLFALLALLGMLVIMPRRRKSRVNASASKEQSMTSEDAADDAEGDYNYMQSEEAIPAKLDLARSYLAMEDYQAARDVLAEILKVGTPSQCEAAQSILDNIPLRT